MKTREMFASLRAFARLAAPAQADALCQLAEIFRGDKDETVTARLKRASAPPSYPAGLNESVAAIEAALSECGAKKQAADFRALLSLFAGRPDSTVEQFVTHVCDSLIKPDHKPPKKKVVAPDSKLARNLADELTRNATEPERFSSLVEMLKDPKVVSTPTLAMTANYFLGNKKEYKGRKPAIEDVIKRHKEEMRFAARGKALTHLGV